MKTILTYSKLLIVMAGLLAIAGCGAESAPVQPESPNVLVVLIDALRQDTLGIYGHEVDTSPFLDELFADGTVFEKAYAQSSQTVFSTASLFTSSDFPLLSENSGRNSVLLPQNVTIAELFAENGYQTFGLFTNPNHHDESGYQQGFETAEFLKPTKKKGYADAVEVEERFVEWLDDLNRDEPFLAYLHFMDVHYPYDPPQEYRDRFVKTPGEPFYINGIPEGDEIPSEQTVQHMRELYDGEMRYTDTVLSSVWETLEERGLAGNTIVVFCSDHGDEFMEHGGLGHGGGRVEQELVRVPLMMYGLPGADRRRVGRVVGNLDIGPTLADAVGFSVPASWMGESLMPLARSADSVPNAGAARYARNSHARSVSTDDWHYILQHRDPSERLHRNDRTDFFGTVNVLDQHADVAQSLAPELEAYDVRAGETKSMVKELMKELEGTVSEDLPDDIRDQLETLGYLD